MSRRSPTGVGFAMVVITDTENEARISEKYFMLEMKSNRI
jgi:hypothetical protein